MMLEWRSLMSTERTARQLLVQVLQPVVPDNAEPEYDVYLPNLVPKQSESCVFGLFTRDESAHRTRATSQVWAVWGRR